MNFVSSEYDSISKTVLNDRTGELNQEIYLRKVVKRKANKKGWQMVYRNQMDEIIKSLNSNKENNMFISIKNRFSKSVSEIAINKTVMAKEFYVSRKTMSLFISKLIRLNFIMELKTGGYIYNPFVFIPLYADGLEMQDKWEYIIDNELFSRRGLSLREIDDIGNGKIHIIDSPTILKI